MIEMDSKEIQTEAGSITKTIALWIQDFLIGRSRTRDNIYQTDCVICISCNNSIVLAILIKEDIAFCFS